MKRVENLEKQVRTAPLEQTVRDDYRRRPCRAAQIIWSQRRDEMLMRAAVPVPRHEPFPASREEDRRTHNRPVVTQLIMRLRLAH